MGSSLPQASVKGARASPDTRIGARAVAVVALIAPLALFGAYHLGARAHSSQQTGASQDLVCRHRGHAPGVIARVDSTTAHHEIGEATHAFC
jgi:hypothetical protein